MRWLSFSDPPLHDSHGSGFIGRCGLVVRLGVAVLVVAPVLAAQPGAAEPPSDRDSPESPAGEPGVARFEDAEVEQPEPASSPTPPAAAAPAPKPSGDGAPGATQPLAPTAAQPAAAPAAALPAPASPPQPQTASAASPSAAAPELSGTPGILDETWDLGVSVGALLPGEIEVTAANQDPKISVSPLVRAIFDSYLIPKFAAGLSLAYAAVSLDSEQPTDDWGPQPTDFPDGISLVEVAGTLKARFAIGDRVAVKPGVALGYNRAFSSERLVRFEGIAVNGSLELQYLLPSGLKPYLELTVLSQPHGGVRDVTYVYFGPLFSLSAGVALGSRK